MKKAIIFLVISFLFLSFASACGNSKDSQANPDSTTDVGTNGAETEKGDGKYLYETANLKLMDTPGWELEENGEDGNIVFVNNGVKAILTEVSKDKPLEEITEELIFSFKNAEILESRQDHLLLKTKRNESVVADIYFYPGERETSILIFMTREDEYESKKPIIEKLKENAIQL